MNNRDSQRSESGQSLVLIALSAVLLLGMSGLAIDGGILFSDRRHAQNAADSAAMAGAFAILQGNDPVAAAYARAADNDFDDNGTTNWVTVEYPPSSGPYAGDYNHIYVEIDSKVDAVFSQMVFSGPLMNTVSAIGRAKPASVEPLLLGNAVVGLAPTGCAVVWSHGNNATTIDGGGIHVNSDDPNCAFKASGSNELSVIGDDIDVVGGFEISGSATVDPPPTAGVDPLAEPEIDPPTCSTNATRDDGNDTFTPGYTDNFRFNGGNWTLDSGIYCVDGGFTVNSGTVLNGEDVFIYVMTGDVTWNGSAEIHLDAMDSGEYAGLLIYQAVGNTDMATINGGSDSTWTGTMYFPSAEVQVNGGGGTDGFNSQVIGDTVDMSGSSDINITYNEDENYLVRKPPQVELAQ
ncbi:MAG: pilus assembly protein TadG-related protein [Anaerolineales bacterium]|nr:pilus assembly protein TadG-related protein [Anaerolineales bacterium]